MLTGIATHDSSDRRNNSDELDLLAQIDVSEEIRILHDDVDEAASRYEDMLDSPWKPELSAHGAECKDCEFKLDTDNIGSGFAKCWGPLAFVKPHLLELSRVGTCRHTNGLPLVQAMVKDGTASLLDVPESCLSKKRRNDWSSGGAAAEANPARAKRRWLDRSQISSPRWTD